MKQVYTELASKPIGPYSQAITFKAKGKMLYTSGVIAIDPATNELVNGGIKEQTKQVFKNISAILGEAGTSLIDVVKVTVFLKDMNEFSAMNEIYAECFGEHKPARSTVEVARLPKDAKVEIEVFALI